MNSFWSREERLSLYQACLNHWGRRAQEDQLIEELAEKIVAINHYRRKPTEENRSHLAEECADVLFMVEEIIYLHDSTPPSTDSAVFSELVQDWFTTKLNRTRARLDDSMYEEHNG